MPLPRVRECRDYGLVGGTGSRSSGGEPPHSKGRAKRQVLRRNPKSTGKNACATEGDCYLGASSGEATLDSEAQVMSRGMKGVTASGWLGRMRMAQPKKPLFLVRSEAWKR